MIAEWRLDPAVVGGLSRPGRFGDTLDFAVCASTGAGRMDCFPLHSAGGRVLRDLPDRVDGHFIPMHYALEGKSGVARARDYRGVASIVAYQPIGTLGLGSVLRLDADQLYAPIVHRLVPLLYVFPLLALGAILLLRVQTLPLVRRMEESEERFRTMADYTYDWEYWRGPNCRIVYMSPSCERITGYTQAEFLADPSLVERIVHPDDRQQVATHLEHYRDDTNHSIDFRIVTKQGAVRWLAHSCSPIFRADGAFLGRRVSNHEITDRKRAEEELARAKERLELALEASSLSIWEYDIRERLVVLDEHWAELIGGAPGETVAAPEELMRRVHPEDAPRMVRAAAATIRGGAAFFQEEVRIQCPEGWKWILCSGKVDARDADGRAVRMVGTNRDITQHKSAEERIHHWAYFDRLTNLPNRRLLEDRLQQLLVQARRKRSLVALLFIDLDRFKPINDEHGHEWGIGFCRPRPAGCWHVCGSPTPWPGSAAMNSSRYCRRSTRSAMRWLWRKRSVWRWRSPSFLPMAGRWPFPRASASRSIPRMPAVLAICFVMPTKRCTTPRRRAATRSRSSAVTRWREAGARTRPDREAGSEAGGGRGVRKSR